MTKNEQRNRTLIIGLLCLCLLILVTASLYQNKSTAKDEPLGEGIVRLGDIPVVQVNGTAIYESDIQNAALEQKLITASEDLPAQSPGYQEVLDGLIDQRLMALEAMGRSLDQEKPARRRLAQAKERILGNIMLETHLRETVTDEALQKLFDAQAATRTRGYEVRARHIQLADMESAKNIVVRLAAGEPFGSLALAFSTDRASRENSGDLGYFTNDMLDPIFTQAAFSAEIGKVQPIFKTADGWHVVEVLDRRRAPEPTFEDIKDNLHQSMTYDEINRLLIMLRQNAQIERLTTAVPEASTDETTAEQP